MTIYQNIFFDLDGTIVDSNEGIINSALYALKEHNLFNYSVEDIKRAIIGPPLYLGFKNLTNLPDEKIEKLVLSFREYYTKDGVYQNQLYPGIIKLLEELKLIGCSLYIITSKPTRFALQILKQHKIFSFFKSIDGAGEKDKKSTKTEKIKKYITEEKNRYLMIGDTLEDINAGSLNGIDTVAATYGFGKKNDFEKVNPTYFVDCPLEILEIITENVVNDE